MSASTEASAEILGTEAEQKAVLCRHLNAHFNGELDMKGCSWDFLSWVRKYYPARLFELEGTVLKWKMNPVVQKVNSEKSMLALTVHDDESGTWGFPVGMTWDPKEIMEELKEVFDENMIYWIHPDSVAWIRGEALEDLREWFRDIRRAVETGISGTATSVVDYTHMKDYIIQELEKSYPNLNFSMENNQITWRYNHMMLCVSEEIKNNPDSGMVFLGVNDDPKNTLERLRAQYPNYTFEARPSIL